MGMGGWTKYITKWRRNDVGLTSDQTGGVKIYTQINQRNQNGSRILHLQQEEHIIARNCLSVDGVNDSVNGRTADRGPASVK